MPKLSLNVSPVDGEFPVSLASRLAQRNGVALKEFLRDMGIRLADLIDGRPEAVVRLAELAGQPEADLLWNAPRREGGWVWFRGERFPKASFRSHEVRGCKDCLHEAHALRADWLYGRQTYCHAHGRPLSILWSVTDPSRRYDVTAHPGPKGQAVARREPSLFEVWLKARLSGQPGQANWLDQFDLWAAVEFVAALGEMLVTKVGKHVQSSASNRSYAAQHTGFVSCKSENAVLAALTKHQQDAGSPALGQRRVFGPLYDLLADPRMNEGLEPFKDLLRRHIEATWPLGPGDELLGEPVLERRFFPAEALAPFSRALSLTVDTTDGRQHRGRQPWALIVVADLCQKLKLLENGLDAGQLRQVLGLNPQLFDQLCDAGEFDAARKGAGWEFNDAHAILDDVLRGAEALVRPRSLWRSVAQAAHELGLSQVEVLRLAKAGDFLRIGCDIRRHGFARIMIDLTGADGSPVPLAAFARAQGLALTDLEALVRAGSLETCEIQAEATDLFVRPRTVPAVSPEAMAQFHRRFVSRRKLGLQWRLGASELTLRLQERGIRPVPGTKDLLPKQVF